MPDIKHTKSLIRPYLQQISDTALWQLCAMAKDGKIEFLNRCSCIRGIVGGGTLQGYDAENTNLSLLAELGLLNLGFCKELQDNIHLLSPSEREKFRDRRRNVILLPMIRAEIRRRERAKQQIVFEEQQTISV